MARTDAERLIDLLNRRPDLVIEEARRELGLPPERDSGQGPTTDNDWCHNRPSDRRLSPTGT